MISRSHRGVFRFLAICLPAMAVSTARAELPKAEPAELGFDAARLSRVGPEIERAIEERKMPGCVLAFGRHGKLAWLRAYGNRQLEPAPAPMTVDTLFDMASITKPVATATSLMTLVEDGKVRLRDKAADHLPDFGRNGKDAITVGQLLVHTSGLIADNTLDDYSNGPEAAWQRICDLKPAHRPGERFIYSDVGFIVLAELIRKVAGHDIHAYSQSRIFGPLGMRETGYLPPDALRQRAAPTESRDGAWIQGDVHDPRAHALGGIAGHAGLFSTASDLAVYSQMMLNRGEYAGQRVLGPATVDAMTAPIRIPGGVRGLGWDKRSAYSSNRGETFSASAFGHGGFTGTVLWIDPELDLFFIFLSNRVHPDGKGLVNPLAGRLGTIIASAIVDAPRPNRAAQASVDSWPETSPVLTGIDVLRRDGCALLRGSRVGLITNQTGIAADGTTTTEILRRAEGVRLAALFSPEHGIEGKLDVSRIDDSVDPATRIRVHSLYGATRKPTAESLAEIDTLVFDMGDIGTRFYTYVSTMGLAMEAAAEHGKRFVVLDRPNPINGVDVSGPVLDAGRESFVGYHRVPVRHGMTSGELAGMIRGDRGLRLDLHVVRMEGWRRSDYYDATDLPWVNTSPNMRTLDAALLYPGIGLLETTNVSVGRGTDTPFEWFGAPWLDPIPFSKVLNADNLSGLRFMPVWFTPSENVFRGERCGGIQITITDRAAVDPLRAGFAIARRLREAYPDAWTVDKYDRLLGNKAVWESVRDGKAVDDILERYDADLRAFLDHRRTFLLY